MNEKMDKSILEMYKIWIGTANTKNNKSLMKRL
jgi:hypothetical protein